MTDHEVGEGSHEGLPTVVLRSPGEEIEASFAPGVGMAGCSLMHGGDELLGQRGGLIRYAETGSSMGIPLLYPWANRLGGLAYEAGGRRVELDPSRSPLRLDANGLPIHGLLTASRLWEVTSTQADASGARLSASLDFAAHEELLAAFPFPHELCVDATLAGSALSIETRVRATGDCHVPVAFGWHPYLTLPGVPRVDWRVAMPVRRQARLDERGLPTGDTRPSQHPAGEAPLGARELDDLFPELDPDPVFTLAGGGRRLEVAFRSGYPVAQVYAPGGQDFICFEPMTVPTDALRTQPTSLPAVPPGSEFVAAFSITVGAAGTD